MISKNLKAFLDMIAWSEGTTRIEGNKDGYNVLVGGGLFTDMTNHPHQLIHVNQRLDSTAAGRYQLLARYYDFYRKLLGLNDFSPASQDAIAIQQIKECRALKDVEAGRFNIAVNKCAHIWASLPGANYGQHENKLPKLQEMYLTYGGSLQ
jgi:muramidase (phage lysozyme)